MDQKKVLRSLKSNTRSTGFFDKEKTEIFYGDNVELNFHIPAHEGFESKTWSGEYPVESYNEKPSIIFKTGVGGVDGTTLLGQARNCRVVRTITQTKLVDQILENRKVNVVGILVD